MAHWLQVPKYFIPRRITCVRQREVEEGRINNHIQFQQFTSMDLFQKTELKIMSHRHTDSDRDYVEIGFSWTFNEFNGAGSYN